MCVFLASVCNCLYGRDENEIVEAKWRSNERENMRQIKGWTREIHSLTRQRRTSLIDPMNTRPDIRDLSSSSDTKSERVTISLDRWKRKRHTINISHVNFSDFFFLIHRNSILMAFLVRLRRWKISVNSRKRIFLSWWNKKIYSIARIRCHYFFQCLEFTGFSSFEEYRAVLLSRKTVFVNIFFVKASKNMLQFFQTLKTGNLTTHNIAIYKNRTYLFS